MSQPLSYPDFSMNRPPSTAKNQAVAVLPILERSVGDDSARLHLSSQYSQQEDTNEFCRGDYGESH